MIVTNGNSYYLGKDGAMVTRGEIEWERKSYYVKSDGRPSEKGGMANYRRDVLCSNR